MPEDRILECADCHAEFTFTVREQEFYASKTDERTGQPWNPPKRCKPCRDVRKQNKKSQGN